ADSRFAASAARLFPAKSAAICDGADRENLKQFQGVPMTPRSRRTPTIALPCLTHNGGPFFECRSGGKGLCGNVSACDENRKSTGSGKVEPSGSAGARRARCACVRPRDSAEDCAAACAVSQTWPLVAQDRTLARSR